MFLPLGCFFCSFFAVSRGEAEPDRRGRCHRGRSVIKLTVGMSKHCYGNCELAAVMNGFSCARDGVPEQLRATPTCSQLAEEEETPAGCWGLALGPNAEMLLQISGNNVGQPRVIPCDDTMCRHVFVYNIVSFGDSYSDASFANVFP